jgi:hypothetical protein
MIGETQYNTSITLKNSSFFVNVAIFIERMGNTIMMFFVDKEEFRHTNFMMC